MTVDIDPSVFFRAYGEAFDDGEKLSGFYGDCALASAPNFVGCLKGKAEIQAALAGVAENQVRTGMTSLVPLKVDTTEIDSIHSWSKVRWGAKFEKTGDRRIEFDVSYLLRRDERKTSILLYVSHQDEQELRQELGIA
jgi:hypothetical protein